MYHVSAQGVDEHIIIIITIIIIGMTSEHSGSVTGTTSRKKQQLVNGQL